MNIDAWISVFCHGIQVFFLDGRVVFGPDPRGLILTVIAVVLSEWIFLADVVDPSSKHPILIAAFSMALAAAVSFTTMNVLQALLFQFGSFVIIDSSFTGDCDSAADRNKRLGDHTKKPDFTVTRSWHEHRQKNWEPAHRHRRRRVEAEVLPNLRHLPCSEELPLCHM
jgi:hypothetical protein